MVIIAAVTLTAIMVGVVFAVQSRTQHFPPVHRPIQITTLCDTLDVSPNTAIPDVGTEGVVRFQCNGSASNCNFNLGLDCAFNVGNGHGGGGGFTTPTFTLPAGYVHVWVKGAATGVGQNEVQDCSTFDDANHWLASGTPIFLGNISHVYCAHLDADTGDIPGFDIIWN